MMIPHCQVCLSKDERRCNRKKRWSSFFTLTLCPGNIESPRVPCYVREQLHQMIGDDNMRILTADAYLYNLDLDREPEMTEICGDDWDELVEHYGLYFDDMIMVHLDEGAKFLRAEVFGKDMQQKKLINEPDMQVNYVKYPLAIQGREEILNALEKPPSTTLSVQETSQVISFARQHYDRIGRIVIHKLTKNNLGSKTLKLSRAFKEELDIPSSRKIMLHNDPVGLEWSVWSQDDLGRFVLEKETWNKFAGEWGLRNGSVVQFCFTQNNGLITMHFSEYEC